MQLLDKLSTVFYKKLREILFETFDLNPLKR